MKTLFVTDGRSPAVRELAVLLAERGFYPILNCPSGESVPAGCGRAQVPLSSESALRDFLSGLDDSFAGVLHPFPPFLRAELAQADDALWDTAFQEGPLAALHVVKAAGGVLASRGGGALVFLGDLHGEKPTGCGFLHSLSGGALQMLCREATLDYGPQGVSCHFLQRGVLAEDLERKNRRSNLYSAPELQTPGGRLSEPKDYAGLLAFLFSGEAGVLNGADLRADSGGSMYYGRQLSEEETESLLARRAAEPRTAPPPFQHGDPYLSSPKGRVALITGGGKGVGAGIARVFCGAGMRVCIGWNSSEALAKQTLAEIEAAGGEAFLFRADVTDRAQLEAMAAETARRYGGIDVLVNNAALQPNLFIRQYDDETFRRVWEINIGGYFRALQCCLPYLQQSKAGRVVNVSSIHGKRPTVFDPGYAMTKGAIRMFTREAALELAADRVTVNSIELGACRIEGKTGDYLFRIRKHPGTAENPGNPLGRVCDPEDAGFLALYLASPEAGMMTGAGVRLDGGAMLV